MKRYGVRMFVAALAVSLTVAVAGCSSTKSAESGSEQSSVGAENTEYEIEAYLVGEGTDFIVKARGADWKKVRPFLVDLFRARDKGSSRSESGRFDALAEAAKSGLPAFASELTGYDLTLEHLDLDRAAYLVFNPRRHSPSQACLSVGLPCVLFENPGPRYGRLILPTESPSKLAGELEGALGDASYRLVEHDYHVRVEFATDSKPADRVAEHLEERVDDQPEDDHYGRQSPARQRVLSSKSSFGAYLDLRGAIDGARYQEQWALAEALTRVSEENRMEKLLAWTAGITQLTKLDMPERAEVEDVSFVLDGDGETYHVDAVYTQTRRGREMANRAHYEATLPEIQIESPGIHAEWSLRLDKVLAGVEDAVWLERALGESSAPRVPLAAQWAWLGTLRAPSSVTASVVEGLEQRIGIDDLSSIVAGRVRLGSRNSKARKRSASGTPGGAVLLLAPDSSGELVERLEAFAGGAGAVRVETREQENGFTEVRLALNTELATLFGEGATPSSVDAFGLEVAPGFLGRGADRLAVGRGMASAEARRMIRGLAEQGPLSISRAAGNGWVSYRAGFGETTVTPHTFESVDYKLTAPEDRCMERAALEIQGLIEEALGSDDLDAFLADRFSSDIGGLRGRISDCGGSGEAESNFAEWAKDYLDAWYALSLYRSGGENWSKRLLEVCETGHEWACGPEEGTWPWTRAEK